VSRSASMPDRPLFDLGKVLATPGAIAALERFQVNHLVLLLRHQCGDWGDVSPADSKENHRAAKSRCRILSSYPIGETTRIWIITEADRSVTTLLLPDEY